MKITWIGVVTLALLLAGCFMPKKPPAISHLDKSAGTVTVQAEPGVEWELIQKEATRGCSTFGGKAVSLSNKCGYLDGYICYWHEYLFACEEDIKTKQAKAEEACAQLALGSKSEWDSESDKTYDTCMMRKITGN